MRIIRSTIACLLMGVASVATVGRADATTVDTFSFTQNGYTGEPFNLVEQGSLSGTFTGTVESDGLIELGDLSSISYTFTEIIAGPLGGSFITIGNVATFFSFDVEDFINNHSTSTFDFIGLLSNGFLANAPVCVGAAAAFGECLISFPGFNIGVVELTAATTEPVMITLVSSVTTTPLPTTWTMLIAGFVGLGFFAYLGTKKRSAAVAAA